MCSVYTGANINRLILYFPVSALVTLFGNILQNPQDPRARSDVRLMNLVVSFLSMLSSDEENGGVQRMLGVCSEFERIAKVVLDKAEKETSSRRKRKSHEDPVTKGPKSNLAIPPQTQMTNNTQTSMAGVFSPSMADAMNSQNGFSPMGNNESPNSGHSGQWNPDLPNGSEFMSPNGPGMTPFSDIQGYTNGHEMVSPLNLNAFQQPFVPQDLWQMPMTLEWDWADMTGGPYPSFENGLVGDPALHNNNNQHLQHQP
jgi:hypothetical protein